MFEKNVGIEQFQDILILKHLNFPLLVGSSKS